MSSSLISVSLRWLEHGQGLPLPAQQTSGAAGLDLAAALLPEQVIEIAPGDHAIIPTSTAIALPRGTRHRSGRTQDWRPNMASWRSMHQALYRGEIKVLLINHGAAAFPVRRCERIAQMVVAPVSAVTLIETETLDNTERGEDGHSSTDR
ncbi:MAG: dUTP diphosphatase [Candidatus Devosia symbiotica]|nr:dUTP diphosphatase [Candidatus Devosia symbiotica]